jgi:tetratricopeptide (TPR) repeat protein
LRWSLVLLFGVALAIRVGYLVDSSDHPGFRIPIVDASFYDLAARQLAGSPVGDAGERVGGEQRLFWQPFLYPRIVAAVYAAGGSILTVKGLQAVLGSLTVLGTFLLGYRRLGHGPGLAAGLVVALYGPLVLFEGELLAAGWAAFEAVALLLLLEWADGGSRRALRSAVFGVAGAAAVLTRPTFLPFLLAAGIWLALRALRSSEGRRWTAAAAVAGTAGAAFTVAVLPVAFAAAPVTGSFSFLPASGPLNLFLGNSEDLCATLTIRPGAEWGELLKRADKAGETGPGSRRRYFRQQVLELARQRPEVFIAHLGAKALRFLSSRELPRNLDVYLWRRWSRLLSVLTWKAGPFGFPFGVLLPLAAVGVVWSWRRLGTPLLLMLSLYPLAVIAVFVSARYRVPLVPAMAVAAAAGGAGLVEGMRERRWKRVAAMLAVVVGMGLVASLPGPFCEEELPAAADFWRNLGSAQELRGERAAAVESYRRALDEYDRELPEGSPKRHDAWGVHLNLGRLLAAGGQIEESLSHYRQAAALAPEQGDPYYNLGLLLGAQGQAAEAAVAFEEAARREPDLPRVQLHRARMLLAAGRPQQALEAARQAVERAPGDPQARFVFGGLLLNRGHSEEAVKELEQAVALEPTAEVHNELATALVAVGRPTDALRHFEAALALRPSYVEALTNLGALLAMTGRLPEARERFERAVRLAPENPIARFDLARVLAAQGERKAAVEELRRVLEIAPGQPAARRLLEELEGDTPG